MTLSITLKRTLFPLRVKFVVKIQLPIATLRLHYSRIFEKYLHLNV